MMLLKILTMILPILISLEITLESKKEINQDLILMKFLIRIRQIFKDLRIIKEVLNMATISNSRNWKSNSDRQAQLITMRQLTMSTTWKKSRSFWTSTKQLRKWSLSVFIQLSSSKLHRMWSMLLSFWKKCLMKGWIKSNL